jgi:hypothetical protein
MMIIQYIHLGKMEACLKDIRKEDQPHKNIIKNGSRLHRGKNLNTILKFKTNKSRNRDPHPGHDPTGRPRGADRLTMAEPEQSQIRRKGGNNMKIKFPMVIPSKPSKHRSCTICEDGTIADVEYSFRTGSNSSSAIAYCRRHADQLIEEMADFKNKQ